MSDPEQDARAELTEIACAVRGLVEWHESCGAAGLASDVPANEALGYLDPTRPVSREPRAQEVRRALPEPAVPNVTRPARLESPIAVDPVREARPATTSSAEAEPVHVSGGDRTHRPATFGDAPIPIFSLEEKRKRLGVLAEKVKDCKECVLCETRKQTVFARGDAAAELVFIGEGPGADEDAQGLPFVGKAGQLLDKMIGAMGMRQDEIYICNIVKCRPPENREPLPQEVQACSNYLVEQLELVRPKVIVTLGNVPLKALFNVQGIMKLRGTWRLYKGKTPVMPTYHPAYVLRNPTPQVRGDVWNDLKLVMKQLGRVIPPRAAG